MHATKRRSTSRLRLCEDQGHLIFRSLMFDPCISNKVIIECGRSQTSHLTVIVIFSIPTVYCLAARPKLCNFTAQYNLTNQARKIHRKRSPSRKCWQPHLVARTSKIKKIIQSRRRRRRRSVRMKNHRDTKSANHP